MTIAHETIEFSWQQVAAALFRFHGVSSGLWRIGAGLRFAAANTGPNESEMMPSGVVGVEKLVLARADGPGPLVFDAAQLSKLAPSPSAKKAATGRRTTPSAKRARLIPTKR